MISNLYDVIQVSSGRSHSMFLTSDGRVYGYGSNEYDQLGIYTVNSQIYTPTLIPNLHDITQVSCGGGHTPFLASDGHVYGCGSNRYSQLGLPDKQYDIPTLLPNIVQIACGPNHSFLLTTSGNVYGIGYNMHYQLGIQCERIYSAPTLIPNLYNIMQVSCGSNHSMFLTVDNQLYGVGDNRYKQLGLQDEDIYIFQHSLQ